MIVKKGEVKGNLTEDEKDGLKSLQKRIREGQIGKLCAVSIRGDQKNNIFEFELALKLIPFV